MEDADRTFQDKLQKGRTGNFTVKDSGNRKQRPKARQRQTSPDRAPGLGHLPTLPQRRRDGRASGVPVSGPRSRQRDTWPGDTFTTDPRRLWSYLERIGAGHWGGDRPPSPDREWERESQTEARAYWRERDSWGWTGGPLNQKGQKHSNEHSAEHATYPQKQVRQSAASYRSFSTN